jgi:hypothetical protein
LWRIGSRNANSTTRWSRKGVRFSIPYAAAARSFIVISEGKVIAKSTAPIRSTNEPWRANSERTSSSSASEPAPRFSKR